MHSQRNRTAKYTYRERHQALFQFKKSCTRNEAADILTKLGTAFEHETFEFSDIFATEEKSQAYPNQPIFLKMLYAKENHKYEIHMELEWMPSSSMSGKDT